MTLTQKEKKFLRGRAQTLPVMVKIGKNGLTDQVLAEIDRALGEGGLIKIRVEGSREAIAEAATAIPAKVSCLVIGQVGKTLSLYREPAEPGID